MATRKTRRRAARKTARKYNGGVRKSAKVIPLQGKVEDYTTYPKNNNVFGYTTDQQRKTLKAAHNKRTAARSAADAATAATAVNKRGLAIMKKIPGNKNGTLNCNGKWSPSSSSTKSKKNSPIVFSKMLASIQSKPAEKLPIDKNLSAIQNAVEIANRNAKIIQQELKQMRNK